MNLQDYCDCGPCPVRKLHGPYTVVRASWMLRLQCLILLGIPVRLSPDSIPPLPPPESCTLPLPCGDWALFVKWPRLICKHKVGFKMYCNWMGKVIFDRHLFDFFFIRIISTASTASYALNILQHLIFLWLCTLQL